jgi:hypothetical protein
MPAFSMVKQAQGPACLEIDASDLGVSWRFLNRLIDRSSGKEIVLYERTLVGAGFGQSFSQLIILMQSTPRI